ncbi:MAG: glycosyltransferase family 4 protein [Chloroflexota bacterium]|nr:glycosyltransferase family 4 protein [Chloroflexota bacterium]
MKVAILGRYPVNGRRVAGGPDAVVSQLASGLQQMADVEVHVVTLSSQVPEDAFFERDGIWVHSIRPRRLPRWTMLRLNARALEQALKAIAPDVVHAHDAGTYADAALASGYPAVITVHGVIQREAELSREYGMNWRERLSWAYEERYERHCLGRAQDVIAISPYVQDFYQPFTPAQMHLVENPVADLFFHLPDRTEPATILCAARIIHRKNILTLLQAFAQVHAEFPQARLRLAGETRSQPEYAETCRQFVQTHGLQNAVSFLGWLEQDAIQEEYSKCGCLVLVSWQETAPVSIEQAMSAGKAVIASDVGGVRYLLVDGQAGILVDPADVDAQVAAFRRVLTDATLRATLGKVAREQALNRFHPEVVARRTRAVYETMMERQGSGNH